MYESKSRMIGMFTAFPQCISDSSSQFYSVKLLFAIIDRVRLGNPMQYIVRCSLTFTIGIPPDKSTYMYMYIIICTFMHYCMIHTLC